MSRAILAQSGPKRYDNAVVFACDANQWPLALFAAHRIRTVEPDGAYDIVIASPDTAELPAELADLGVRQCQIDVSTLPEVPMFRSWISFATYFRWILPEAFGDDYENLFYLDTDTYLAKPAIGSLFRSIDAPYMIGAVVEFVSFVKHHTKYAKHISDKIRDLGGRQGQYYNAGVLLIQPEAFLTQNGMDQLIDGIKRNEIFDPIYTEQDQGALNLAFADDIVPIDPRLNWCTRDWLRQEIVAHYEPFIYHFAGPNKPWVVQDDPFPATYHETYRQFLSAHFPDFPIKVSPRSGQDRLDNPKYKLKVLNALRVALYERRYRKKIDHCSNLTAFKQNNMDHAIASARFNAYLG